MKKNNFKRKNNTYDETYKQVKIYIEHKDFEEIEKDAEFENMKISAYLRDKLKIKNKLDDKESKINLKFIYELNRIGVNLNQIAKKINWSNDKENYLNELQEIKYRLEELKDLK